MSGQPLFLFNSMGRELQEFKPIEPGRVRLYSCGPTVYNYAHLGNLRAYLFTDTLRRALQFKGYDVLHVMNITDVGHLTSDADEGEDKMELSAERQGKNVWELSRHYTEHFENDTSRLNIMPPSVQSKATDHIEEMVNFAIACQDRGYAYVIDDGLYFDISKVKDYGKIALLDLQGQEAGARVAVKHGKRNQADFAVWRFSPKGKKRQMEWHSPWGVGAPGWHLECSVMSIKYLGNQFDIHTGGIDHRQVHHCNEIAQNQAFLGNDQIGATFWMHNEFLVFGEEKMSKSSGEFLRLQTLIDKGIHPLVYRYFVLQATYRGPIEFSIDALLSARTGLIRLLKRVAQIKENAETSDIIQIAAEARFSRGGSMHFVISSLEESWPPADKYWNKTWIEKLDTAISSDLNTPQALALLNELLDDREISLKSRLALVAVYDLVLGLQLLTLTADDLILRPASATINAEDIQQLISDREEARQSKNFVRADEIRKELTAMGVSLNDSSQGTTWEWLPSVE